MTTPIVVSGLSFAWPDGSPLFEGIDLVIGSGRTSLVGANGSGKSTLLRLMAGELAPGSGSVTVAGTVGYLPQDITLQADLKVQDVLGIGPARAALAAIEAGDTAAEHFSVLGDDWDVEERAVTTLGRLGLGHVTLLLADPAPRLLMLDEPTNNLDLASVRQLTEALRCYRGALLVASHDVPFLRELGLTRWLRLDAGLSDIDPL